MQGAYAQHWIDEEQLWLDMLDERNRTSLACKREVAQALLRRLPRYREAMRALHTGLAGRLLG